VRLAILVRNGAKPVDVLELIRYESRAAYAWIDNIVSGITHVQANWQPPGTANSIAATYAHALISADVDLNQHFHGRAPIISGEWGARVGLHDLFPDDFTCDGEIRWNELHRYGKEVERCVGALVDALTMDDLNRSFEMMATDGGEPTSLGMWKGIDIYQLHGWSHIRMHGGEIACLKGLQGLTGYRPPSSRYGLSAVQQPLRVNDGEAS
jgi:hypothetical protein